MKKISSCLLLWINDKGYYSKSYGKNHNMPKITILVDNCGGQNKSNVMIRFLNIIKEGIFFGTATLYLYIKGHINNDCNRAFNRLRVLYHKKNDLTFEKCCEILNTRNNI